MTNQTLKNHRNSIAELQSRIATIQERMNPVIAARQTAQEALTDTRALTNAKKSLLARIFLGEPIKTDAIDAEIVKAKQKLDSLDIDPDVASEAQNILQAQIDDMTAQLSALTSELPALQRQAMLATIESLKGKYLASVDSAKQDYLKLLAAAQFYDQFTRAGYSDITPLAFAWSNEFLLPLVAADSRSIYFTVQHADSQQFKQQFEAELRADGVL